MALVDVFYPGNQAKRDELVQLSTKLYCKLDSNFKTVNKLIDCIHQHMPGRTFTKVYLVDSDSIKTNCDRLVSRIEEIQKYLDEIVAHIKEKLDPSVFKQLMDADISMKRRFHIARTVIKFVEFVGFTFVGVALTGFFCSKLLLSGVSVWIARIGGCALGCLAAGLLILVVDAIISAIVGKIEQDKLDEKISELKTALNKFEPLSDEFNDSVYRLVIRIEIEYE